MNIVNSESLIDNNPIVTVITVIYNEYNNIEDTILSVINQSYSNVEYIIIDGGSTDGTIDIIKKYEDKIAYWISEPDKGIYDAMNKAVAMANGTWITNINAGDSLLLIPHEELIQAEIANYDALCGTVITEDVNIIIPSFNWKINLFNTLPHQGLYYKKSSIYSKYDLSYKIYADFAYNIGMYKRKQKVFLINKSVAFHSINGISNTSNSSKELFKVVYDNGGISTLIASYMYFKLQGLIKRLEKIKSND